MGDKVEVREHLNQDGNSLLQNALMCFPKNILIHRFLREFSIEMTMWSGENV